METKRILIANRGEIAARLIRTYRLFPLSPTTPRIETVTVYTRSESNALHAHLADRSVQLEGEGPKAYLDATALVALARGQGCWGIAPGYGFLSEDAGFAKLCEESGLVFLGPTSHQLQLLGNKVSARQLAEKVQVPVLPGTKASTSSSALSDIIEFAKAQPLGSKIILKAANGGGGRGIRILPLPSSSNPGQFQKLVTEAYESCSREALSSFGEGTVYAERFLTNARHVEVQILGDGEGGVCHFWDRECSLQRRNQKMVEIAPAGTLAKELRQGMLDAALRLGREVKLRSLATIEFLVDQENGGGFYFMEANPRIQVEHTITEQVTGVDLVALQLLVGLGATMTELSLTSSCPTPFPTKVSIQARVNAESFRGTSDEAHPESGTVSSLIWPLGREMRVESAAHPPHPVLGKYKVNPLFDSLLAKVIVTAPNFTSALEAGRRALTETTIEGVRTNIPFLLALLTHEQVKQDRHHIHTVQTDFPVLLEKANGFEAEINARSKHTEGDKEAAKVEGGKQVQDWEAEGKATVKTHLSGLVVKISVKEGERVAAGQELAVIEAMKMEHVIRASAPGAIVHKMLVEQDGVVNAGDVLLVLTPSSLDVTSASDADSAASTEAVEDPTILRPELKELFERRKAYADEGRASMVTKRHARGYRTVRENLSMLVDPDSLIEYGDLALASQRARRSIPDLIAKTTGDGIVTGFAKIATHTVALILGDYLVLAGTQGRMHHYKFDRILNAILSHPCPVVLYAEGGGGRPGDTDVVSASGLVTPSFALMGRVRAMGIPSVGVANGYVFAGNAALLGTCDVVVATRGGIQWLAGEGGGVGKTSIGMGGSAMIEAGGLGVFGSDEIGPVDVHCATGGIDVLVDNEDEAAAMTRRLINIFTTPRLPEREWKYSANPLSLRTCIPPASERRRAFDMRKVISLLVDDDSFVEFSPHWGVGLITGFVRINGTAIAILANDALSPLGGAIDLNCALKAVRLLRLLTRTRACHLVCLCDTPGFMVGPEFERTANMGSFRVFGDWFSAANEYALSGGKIVGLVLRRAFGLGAQAMLGGSTQSNSVCACWPTASLGPMSLEGAVKLGFKKQLEAIKDEDGRRREEERLVEGLYKQGEGANVASMVEVDTVIDPGESREWLGRVLGVLGERKVTYKVRAEQAINPHL